MIDDSLVTEALNLADGADIHDVAGMVAVYRSLVREGLDASDLERELRRYVVRRRIASHADPLTVGAAIADTIETSHRLARFTIAEADRTSRLAHAR